MRKKWTTSPLLNGEKPWSFCESLNHSLKNSALLKELVELQSLSDFGGLFCLEIYSDHNWFYVKWYSTGWWFQTWLLLSISYGLSSFPLTNSSFSRWAHCTTKQSTLEQNHPPVGDIQWPVGHCWHWVTDVTDVHSSMRWSRANFCATGKSHEKSMAQLVWHVNGSIYLTDLIYTEPRTMFAAWKSALCISDGTRTPSDHAGQATRSWAEHPQGDGMRWVQNGQRTWEELWCWWSL